MVTDYNQPLDEKTERPRILLRGNGDFTPEQYREVMSGENEQHMMLSLGLTTGPGCNMKCVYCYSDGGVNEAGRAIAQQMTLADFNKAITESAALGAESAIIVGIGETLMDRNFKKIVEIIDGEGMYPLIFTNGTLLDKEMAKFLFQHHVTVYLALDSTREDAFNQITQSKGLYSRVMAGIDNCLEAGFGQVTQRNGHMVTDFAVNAMVMKLNIDHLGEIEQFCRDKKLLFTCRLPEKLGNAPLYWNDSIAVTPEEETQLKEEASKHSLGGEVFRTDFGCLFWITGVLLGVDGQARLCYSLNNEKDFGNIKTDSMLEIIRNKHQVYPPRPDFFCPIHAELGLVETNG